MHIILEEWPLVCPQCRTLLQKDLATYQCAQCGGCYPCVDNVIQFSAQDDFYESRYAPQPLKFLPDERTPWGKALLYLVSMHYLWYIHRHVPQGARILDVACGAGMRYLATHGRTAGLEISLTSAREMAKLYDLALQADGLHIPLADSSLDAVVSRFFLEHVPPEDKAKLLAEFHRVLRPGGWLITLQDCECHNPLWQWAKQDVELFRERFIENDGHYGLMYPSENLALFEQAGFDVVAYHASNKTPLVSLSMIQWMQAYKSKSWWTSLYLPIGGIVARNRWLNQAYTFGVTLFDDLVEPFLPLDHARYLLVACCCHKSLNS